jgi:hypothetical protein
MKTPREIELCPVCNGHEYAQDHFVSAEFLPADKYLPAEQYYVHKSHFNEVVDGSDTVYRKEGRYVREV